MAIQGDLRIREREKRLLKSVECAIVSLTAKKKTIEILLKEQATPQIVSSFGEALCTYLVEIFAAVDGRAEL